VGRVRPISGFHVLVDALADKAPDRGDGTGLGEVEAGQTTGESADLETAGG